MTGICAIYSNLTQPRQLILSLTSTAIRFHTQSHVRRSSILTYAHSKSSIATPASKSIRTAVPALTNIFNINRIGGSLSTVSKSSFLIKLMHFVEFGFGHWLWKVRIVENN